MASSTFTVLSSHHAVPALTPGPHHSIIYLYKLDDSRDLTEMESYSICPFVTGWPLGIMSPRSIHVAGVRMSFLLKAE